MDNYLNKSQLERLLDINACLPRLTTVDQLISKTTAKAIQYSVRDKKCIDYAPKTPQYERAVDVIQEYYTRKHNYTENWVE